MRRRFGICILCLCVAAVLTAGCAIQKNVSGTGESGATASMTNGMISSGSVTGKESVTIRIKESSFDPPTITVPAGTTVIWINEDKLAHRVTSTGKGTVRFDSSSLTPGQSYSAMLSTAGRYDYADNQHSFMTGTIIVV